MIVRNAIFVAIAFLASSSWLFHSTKVTDKVVSHPVVPYSVPIVTNNVATLVSTLLIDQKRTILMGGEVTPDSVEQVIGFLSQLNLESDKPIMLILDSPGGSVFDGERLISFIEGSRSQVDTVVYSLCASMCAHIFEHGKTRYMIDRSTLMFHPASGGVEGQMEDMMSLLTYIKTQVDLLDAFVADRVGMNRRDFTVLRQTQLWLSADDAVKRHFADKIVTFQLKGSNGTKTKLENVTTVHTNKAEKNPLTNFN